MPRLGLGMPLSADIVTASIISIDDFMFSSLASGEITPAFTTNRTNLTVYSQDISQSTWVKTSTGVDGTAVEAPDGTTTAQAITGAASNSTKIIKQDVVITAGETYTYSVYVKKGNLDWCRLQAYDGTNTYRADFDIDAEGVGTTSGLLSTAVDVSPDNGWIRCSITFQALSSSSDGNMRVYSMLANNTTTVNVAVADTILIYVWGQQFEADITASPYIPTTSSTATDTTILNDRNSTWDYDGTDLVIEASPDDEGYWDDNDTELVTNGGFDADSGWTKGSGWTISSGVTTSDGTATNLTQSISTAVGNTYEVVFTISAYTSGAIRVVINDAEGSDISSAGTHTAYLTIGVISSGNIIFDPRSAFVGSIDNVSVTEHSISPLDV